MGDEKAQGRHDEFQFVKNRAERDLFLLFLATKKEEKEINDGKAEKKRGGEGREGNNWGMYSMQQGGNEVICS